MQSQKTEALGRFTSGIAHDFNNSLAAITGWVRLAAEDLDTEHPSREIVVAWRAGSSRAAEARLLAEVLTL